MKSLKRSIITNTIGSMMPSISDKWTKEFCKGDVLITCRGFGGLVGHAAIMATDYWVLEMPGGEGWQIGIEDNNRRISKSDWLELHKYDRITLYRNEDTDVAHAAADWAYRNYYNPNGGSEKTKHITYKLTTDIWVTDPSYCSKLVIQAYHFGSGNRDVIGGMFLGTFLDPYIIPTKLSEYFKMPYRLMNVTFCRRIEYLKLKW